MMNKTIIVLNLIITTIYNVESTDAKSKTEDVISKTIDEDVTALIFSGEHELSITNDYVESTDELEDIGYKHDTPILQDTNKPSSEAIETLVTCKNVPQKQPVDTQIEEGDVETKKSKTEDEDGPNFEQRIKTSVRAAENEEIFQESNRSEEDDEIDIKDNSTVLNDESDRTAITWDDLDDIPIQKSSNQSDEQRILETKARGDEKADEEISKQEMEERTSLPIQNTNTRRPIQIKDLPYSTRLQPYAIKKYLQNVPLPRQAELMNLNMARKNAYTSENYFNPLSRAVPSLRPEKTTEKENLKTIDDFNSVPYTNAYPYSPMDTGTRRSNEYFPVQNIEQPMYNLIFSKLSQATGQTQNNGYNPYTKYSYRAPYKINPMFAIQPNVALRNMRIM